MAFNQLSCGANFGNSLPANCFEDFGMIRKIVLVPKDAEFATSAAATTLSNWTTNSQLTTSARWFPYPLAVDIEDQSEDDVFEESTNATEFVRNGKKRFRMKLEAIALGVHQNLRTHNGGEWAAYLITDEGYILGRTLDSTKILPLPLTLLHNEKQTLATGDALQRTYTVVEFDSTDWDDRGVWVKPTAFDPVSDIVGIKDVILTATTFTTSSVVFSVYGAYDTEEITGLVQADFTYSTTFGSELTSVTDNGDGTYTVAPTTVFSTGATTIDLKAPATTGKAYEQTAQLTFTIA